MPRSGMLVRYWLVDTRHNRVVMLAAVLEERLGGSTESWSGYRSGFLLRDSGGWLADLAQFVQAALTRQITSHALMTTRVIAVIAIGQWSSTTACETGNGAKPAPKSAGT